MIESARLEKIGHIASIVMCCCVAVAAIQFVARAQWSAPPVSSTEPGIQIGKQIELPQEVRSTGTAILLLAVSSKCRFCTESMPFYKRLTELPAVRRGQFSLGLLVFQGAGDLADYTKRHGVDIKTTVPVDADLPIRATPTLILVDKTGKIVESWVGYLEQERQGEVERYIERLSSN